MDVKDKMNDYWAAKNKEEESEEDSTQLRPIMK